MQLESMQMIFCSESGNKRLQYCDRFFDQPVKKSIKNI